jgi:hypothetical protein
MEMVSHRPKTKSVKAKRRNTTGYKELAYCFFKNLRIIFFINLMRTKKANDMKINKYLILVATTAFTVGLPLSRKEK